MSGEWLRMGRRMPGRFQARAWLGMAVAAFLLSGVLSLVVTAAKLPGMTERLGAHIWFVRWCLVKHVNLANLVWFTAFPLGLLYLVQGPRSRAGERFAGLAFMLSLLGVGIMLCCLPSASHEPILSNYLPVLHQPVYLMGLGLYGLGVVFAHIHFLSGAQSFLAETNGGESDVLSGLNACRFGLLLGSAYSLLAAGLLIHAGWKLTPYAPHWLLYYDSLFWGCGHALQHANAVFMAVVWIALSYSPDRSAVVSRARLFPVFAWMGFPLLLMPIAFAFNPTADFYRLFFTRLMQWGIAPPLALLLFQIPWRRCLKNSFLIASTLSGSMGLFGLGVVFGASIRGQDLRIPGHYHATIGAVTLAFMGVSAVLLLQRRKMDEGRGRSAFRVSIPLYAIGQIGFSCGLFWAGCFGLGRKTYGTEQGELLPSQMFGIGLAMLGGIIAFAGGACYAVGVLKSIGKTRRPA